MVNYKWMHAYGNNAEKHYLVLNTQKRIRFDNCSHSNIAYTRCKWYSKYDYSCQCNRTMSKHKVCRFRLTYWCCKIKTKANTLHAIYIFNLLTMCIVVLTKPFYQGAAPGDPFNFLSSFDDSLKPFWCGWWSFLTLPMRSVAI